MHTFQLTRAVSASKTKSSKAKTPEPSNITTSAFTTSCLALFGEQREINEVRLRLVLSFSNCESHSRGIPFSQLLRRRRNWKRLATLPSLSVLQAVALEMSYTVGNLVSQRHQRHHSTSLISCYNDLQWALTALLYEGAWAEAWSLETLVRRHVKRTTPMIVLAILLN